MNALSSFLMSFSSSCVLLGFLYMLCPSGSMAKPIKYVFCLCFMCCVISSVAAVSRLQFPEINIKSSGNYQVTETTAAATAQMIFEEALSRENINYRKITVYTDKLPSGSIIISKVIVYTSHTADEIYRVLSPEGYNVEVINE